MRRQKLSKKNSNRAFRKGATNIKAKNATRGPMRGGYRL